MAVLLVVLSVSGFSIATYFTAVAYHWLRPDASWIPTVCRMDDRTCASIVFTPQARVFGLPNSVLGQLFYVGIILGTILGWIGGPDPPPAIYVVASALTVGLGVYLSYALLFINRVACPLCFTAHGINTLIFLVLVFTPT